jgi:hypothetical protein
MTERKRKTSTKFEHGENCRWDGKDGRYTYTRGVCQACDELKSNTASGVYGMSESYFGMSTADMKRIYCTKSFISAERCTKYTNPKCACGKLVYNQAKPPKPKYIEPAFVWVSTEVEA